MADASAQVEDALAAGKADVSEGLRFYRRALALAIVGALGLAGALTYAIGSIEQIKSEVDCVVVSQNGIIKDVPLAFSGDTHRLDYARETTCTR